MTGAIYPTPSPAWVARLAVDETRATEAAGQPRAWVAVDLAAVRHNAECLRERAGVPLVAMLKADGYGVGAVAMARALGATFADDVLDRSHDADQREPLDERGHGETLGVAALNAASLIWGIGVASVQEASALRAAGCTARLLCCTPMLQAEYIDARALAVRPSLHDVADIQMWGANGNLPWHLSIDTGMSREGARWDTVAGLRDMVETFSPEGVFTHFHSADIDDGSRQRQESRFGAALRTLRGALPAPVLVHTDNSAAILSRNGGLNSAPTERRLAASNISSNASSDASSSALSRAPVRPGSPGHLARPGIALHGVVGGEQLPFRPTVQLRARVVDLREISAGDTVGYGATWTAPTARRIATVAIGYGDGYRRSLSNRGVGLLRGVRCPVVGRISMDTTLFDVTNVACERGDVMTLLGRDVGVDADDPAVSEISGESVAATGDLSVYELLVGLRLRLPRVYYASFSGTV